MSRLQTRRALCTGEHHHQAPSRSRRDAVHWSPDQQKRRRAAQTNRSARERWPAPQLVRREQARRRRREAGPVPEASSKRCGNNPKRPRDEPLRRTERSRGDDGGLRGLRPGGHALLWRTLPFPRRAPAQLPRREPDVHQSHDGPGPHRLQPEFISDGQGLHVHPRGTWVGPGWNPSHSLSSVLLSIQSLMNDQPYCAHLGVPRRRRRRATSARGVAAPWIDDAIASTFLRTQATSPAARRRARRPEQ